MFKTTLGLLALATLLLGCPSEPETADTCPYSSCPPVSLQRTLDDLDPAERDAVCQWRDDVLLGDKGFVDGGPDGDIRLVDCGDGERAAYSTPTQCVDIQTNVDCSVDLLAACVTSQGDFCASGDTPECAALIACADEGGPTNACETNRDCYCSSNVAPDNLLCDVAVEADQSTGTCRPAATCTQGWTCPEAGIGSCP